MKTIQIITVVDRVTICSGISLTWQCRGIPQISWKI